MLAAKSAKIQTRINFALHGSRNLMRNEARPVGLLTSTKALLSVRKLKDFVNHSFTGIFRWFLVCCFAVVIVTVFGMDLFQLVK